MTYHQDSNVFDRASSLTHQVITDFDDVYGFGDHELLAQMIVRKLAEDGLLIQDPLPDEDDDSLPFPPREGIGTGSIMSRAHEGSLPDEDAEEGRDCPDPEMGRVVVTVLLVDEALTETEVEVTVPTPEGWAKGVVDEDEEWFETVVLPAVKATGADTDLIEDWWV